MKWFCNSDDTEKTKMINIHKVLIPTIALILTYEYFFFIEPTGVRITDPKFSLLGPTDQTTSLIADDIYDQLIDVKNFTFIVNPQPCKDYPSGLLLMVIVASKPSNYDNRMAIRSSWGRAVDSTRLVFLLGESDNATIYSRVESESNTYGDIVQGNFIDAYHNMTYKHVMGLKWVTHHCPKAKYVLKTDDDVIVNSHELRHFLARELSPWGSKDLIACQVLEHARAHRIKSKWMVTYAEYPAFFYPSYCAGWVVLYSQDVVQKLLKAAQETPYFWIDDVHITGILAQKIGIGRTTLDDLILRDAEAKLLTMFGSRSGVGPFLFGPPEINASRMCQIWKAIPA